MPPRLNKRQLRELEELQALEATRHSDQDGDKEGDEDIAEIQPDENPFSGFAAVRLFARLTTRHLPRDSFLLQPQATTFLVMKRRA